MANNMLLKYVPTNGNSEVSETSLLGAVRKPTVVLEPKRGLFQLELQAVWQYRELLYFLIWRDVKVRYKQTVIGAAWAILQPLMTMVILTLVFGTFAKIPSDGLPYPIFAFTALLPWNYFSQAISRSGASLVSAANLISKVYFPRLLVPVSAATAPLIDFAIAFVVLVGMMSWYGIAPRWAMLAVPLFLLMALFAALAVGLWLSALNVRYRDVGHAIPFLIQFWMFASPVAYPVSLVPEKWRVLYSLNPMAGVIEGFRWAVLGKENPEIGLIALSALIVVPIFIGGLVYFTRVEQTFADIV